MRDADWEAPGPPKEVPSKKKKNNNTTGPWAASHFLHRHVIAPHQSAKWHKMLSDPDDNTAVTATTSKMTRCNSARRRALAVCVHLDSRGDWLAVAARWPASRRAGQESDMHQPASVPGNVRGAKNLAGVGLCSPGARQTGRSFIIILAAEGVEWRAANKSGDVAICPEPHIRHPDGSPAAARLISARRHRPFRGTLLPRGQCPPFPSCRAIHTSDLTAEHFEPAACPGRPGPPPPCQWLAELLYLLAAWLAEMALVSRGCVYRLCASVWESEWLWSGGAAPSSHSPISKSHVAPGGHRFSWPPATPPRRVPVWDGVLSRVLCQPFATRTLCMSWLVRRQLTPDPDALERTPDGEFIYRRAPYVHLK